MELDEDYSVDGLDTVDHFDDTRSISSSASKKPMYQRAWRKVYKTMTAPEKDASGQRMSLRKSISMRLSRDPSVSSSSGSFYTGLRTPSSARHLTSRSDDAMSRTYTAPLPHSSDDASPIQRSRSHAPYSVENAVPLSLPTDEDQKEKLDSARDMHPSPEVPAAPAIHVTRPPVPPLHKTDMSLSQLAATQDTVTPVTSARHGGPIDSPATDPDIPAPTPQFSAASLVQGDDSRSSLQVGGAQEDSVQASAQAMPKRQPDWPAGSNDEPTSKESSHQMSEKPAQSVPAPFGSEHPNLPAPVKTSSRASHPATDATSPGSGVMPAAVELSTSQAATDAPTVNPNSVQAHEGLSASGIVSPTTQVSASEANTTVATAAVPDAPSPQPQAPPSTSTAEAQPGSTVQEAPSSTVPPAPTHLPVQPVVSTEPKSPQPTTQQPPPDRYTAISNLDRQTYQPVPTDVAAPANTTPLTDSAPADASPRDVTAESEGTMPHMQPAQTHPSQMSSVPTPGSSLAVAGSSDPAMQSLPTTPVLYCESSGSPDSIDTENTVIEGSETSGACFVAKDALGKQSSKTGKHMDGVARPTAVKSPLSDISRSHQHLQPRSSINSPSFIEHGSGASAAAAAEADLPGVSSEVPEGTSTSSAQPDVPTTHANTTDMRMDLPLTAGFGTMVRDQSVQRASSEDQSMSVNGVDVRGKGVQGETVNVESDVDYDAADSGPRSDQAHALLAGMAAGGDSDTLESNVRDLVHALEGRLITTGTLQGAISGAGQMEGNSGVRMSGGDSGVLGVDRAESIGSTSGMGAVAGSSSVSAQDVMEKYESAQPRTRHIFSPSPSPSRSGRKEDTASRMHGSAEEDSTETSADVPYTGGKKKRGGVLRTLVQAAAVAAVGAGAAFAVARVS